MNEVQEYLVENLGWTKTDANDAIKDGDIYLMTEIELHDFIAERLDLDSMPSVIQQYFDWDGYIRDLILNRELIEIKEWPESKYLFLYR